jgi:hypothetical protein
MTNRVYVVPQDQPRTGMAIAQLTLIVEPEHVAVGVEWPCTVSVHYQVGQGLVGEKIRSGCGGAKAFRRHRPVSLASKRASPKNAQSAR